MNTFKNADKISKEAAMREFEKALDADGAVVAVVEQPEGTRVIMRARPAYAVDVIAKLINEVIEPVVKGEAGSRADRLEIAYRMEIANQVIDDLCDDLDNEADEETDPGQEADESEPTDDEMNEVAEVVLANAKKLMQSEGKEWVDVAFLAVSPDNKQCAVLSSLELDDIPRVVAALLERVKMEDGDPEGVLIKAVKLMDNTKIDERDVNYGD